MCGVPPPASEAHSGSGLREMPALPLSVDGRHPAGVAAGNLFFRGGNPACRWKNGGKGGYVRSAPLSGERAFSARYFSGYGLPLPPRPLRRAVFSAQCVLAHDAHPPRPLPLKKHHIRRSTTAATTMPIPQTAKSCHPMSEPHEKAVDRPCYDPRQHRVVGHGSRGPFPPGLGADGGDGRNAGEVEEDEYQES